MKKVLALLLAATMALALAACGAKPEEKPADPAAPAAPEKLVIQVAYENNPGEPLDVAATEWQRLVAEKSNGTMEIELFPSSQLGSKTDLMDQIVMGEPIVTICDGSFLAQYGAPELDITSAPYLYKDWDQCWKLIESDWFAEQSKLVEESGIHIITTNWIFGERNIITTRPIQSVADMKGLILRTPNTPSYMKAFQMMGAAPTAMAIGDCYTALQQGTIDGLENTFTTLYGSAYYEVAKNITMTKHVKMFAQWICSQTWFESLTEEQRTILSETGDEAGLFNNDLQLGSTDEYVAKMKEKGVNIIELTDEQRAEFAAASAALYKDPDITGNWRDGLYDLVQEIINA